MAQALAYLREHVPATVVAGALGPRMRMLAAERADGVLLGAVTPALARAAAIQIGDHAQAAGRPVPPVYVNVLAGVGADQLEALRASAAFLRQLPAYAAHFERAGIDAAQTSIAVERVGDLPARLGEWRDTVDEVILVPVTANDQNQVLELVDAAIQGW